MSLITYLVSDRWTFFCPSLKTPHYAMGVPCLHPVPAFGKPRTCSRYSHKSSNYNYQRTMLHSPAFNHGVWTPIGPQLPRPSLKSSKCASTLSSNPGPQKPYSPIIQVVTTLTGCNDILSNEPVPMQPEMPDKFGLILQPCPDSWNVTVSGTMTSSIHNRHPDTLIYPEQLLKP